MKPHCQHCSTSCPPGDPYEGFCCAGCRSVYGLIHESGLEDFYALQDRAGRPVGDAGKRHPQLTDAQLLEHARAVPGGFAATLYLSGMTCRGCAWLVERLLGRAPGVRRARVSLTSGRLELCWDTGFDIIAAQNLLADYGYALSLSALPGLSLSPLALRLVLCGLFAANGGLLSLLANYGVGGGELDGLYALLLLANGLLQQLVGVGVFLRPAWDALRLRRWHSDMIPAGLLSGGFLVALIGLPGGGGSWGPWMLLFLVLVPVFLLARLIADRVALRGDSGFSAPNPERE